MKHDKDQVERFTMLIPRAEAKELLSAVIKEGKQLQRRRTPADLRADSPEARDLSKELKAWGRKSIQAMRTCFGESGAAAARKNKLTYATTLELAKGKLKQRLDLLTKAFDQTKELRKSTLKLPKKRQSKVERQQPKDSIPDKTRRNFKYDFCLSFAGENRNEARELYKLLSRRGARVFYDLDPKQKSRLWGHDLTVALQKIYQYESRYCIMFTSSAYLEKEWTTHESKAARARELKQDGYILPVKLDDTEIPGSPEIKAFLDRRTHRRAEVADAAMEKLNETYPHINRKSQLSKARRGTAPKKKKGSVKVPRSTLVMLGGDFYQAIRYHETGGVVTVTVKLQDNAEKNRLQRLEPRPYGLSSNPLPFAHKHASGRLRVQTLEYTDEAGKSFVTLSGERVTQNTGGTSSIHDEQVLSRQVRWVSFGEALPQHERYALTYLDTATKTRFDKGVLVALWESWPTTQAEFLEAAKLLLTFYLNEMNLLSDMTSLKVGPLRQRKLSIKLKGKREDPYRHRDFLIDINGELELPERPNKR